MKRFTAVGLLTVCLALPAVAVPRTDRETPRERTPVERVLKSLKHFVAGILSWDITVPKP
jgi:hypothetical protein